MAVRWGARAPTPESSCGPLRRLPSAWSLWLLSADQMFIVSISIYLNVLLSFADILGFTLCLC